MQEFKSGATLFTIGITDKHKESASFADVAELLLSETEPVRLFLKESGEMSSRGRALVLAMEEMRVSYRKSWLLLYLLFFKGVSPDEIVNASRGQVTKAQVRKDKSRALARLRAILGKYSEFSDQPAREGEDS